MVVSYKLERGRNIYAFNEYYTGYYTDQRRLKKFKPLSKKSFYLILLKRIKISKTTFLCRFSEAVKVTDILPNNLTNVRDFLILNEYCPVR